MKKLLKLTGITIALTAIGVGVRARILKKFEKQIKKSNLILNSKEIIS